MSTFSSKVSAKYLLVTNLLSKFLAFLGSIVLARLLFPEDYGTLLVASIFTSLVDLFGKMGFEYFYLQEKISNDIYERNVLNITYKLRLLVNAFLFLFQFTISFLVESYYDNQVVGELIRIFSFNHLIVASVQINIFILRKKMDFRVESIGTLIGDISSTVMKILFAFFGFGALSFAYGFLLGNILKTVYILRKQSFIPNLRYWNSEIFERVFHFGKHSFIGGISIFLNNQVEKIIMSFFFPQKVLGGYGFASGQTRNINSIVNRSLGNLIISYIAKNKDRPSRLISKLADIAYIQNSMFLPIYLFTLFNIHMLVVHIFGQKWEFSIPMFEIFIFLFIVSLSYANLTNLLTGLGYPEVNSKISIYQLLVTGPVLMLSVLIDKDIFTFVLLFVIITIFFQMIKSSTGLMKLESNILSFLKQSSYLLHLYFIVIVILFQSTGKIYFDSEVAFLIYSLISTILIWFAFYIYIFRERFMVSLATVIDKESKLYRMVDNIPGYKRN